MTMKKVIQLTLLLLAILLPTTATAYSFKSGGIYYNITSSSDKTVAVTYQNYVGSYDLSVPSGYVYNVDYDPDGDHYYFYTYSDYSGYIVIPSTVNYNGNTYQVTSIDCDAFENCLNVSSITIPNSITSIGDRAFKNCKNPSLTIPSSITYMGQNVFSSFSGSLTINCSSFIFSHKEWVYPDDDDAYYYTVNHNPYSGGKFISIFFGSNVSNIPGDTFSGCTSLTNVTMSGSIVTIGNYAFSGCTNLSALDIDNNSLSSIGVGAFSGCTKLKSVNINNLNG